MQASGVDSEECGPDYQRQTEEQQPPWVVGGYVSRGVGSGCCVKSERAVGEAMAGDEQAVVA